MVHHLLILKIHYFFSIDAKHNLWKSRYPFFHQTNFLIHILCDFQSRVEFKWFFALYCRVHLIVKMFISETNRKNYQVKHQIKILIAIALIFYQHLNRPFWLLHPDMQFEGPWTNWGRPLFWQTLALIWEEILIIESTED